MKSTAQTSLLALLLCLPCFHGPSPVFGATAKPNILFITLAHYYSSVRRADDCVGAVLKALKESGQEKSTVVVFLSNHGMPLPFAKTQLCHHSTHTPWIVRWPGVTKAGSSDGRPMISAVDFLPTMLDITGLAHPEGLDGRSFLPVLKGESQDGRDLIFKEYNENSGGKSEPVARRAKQNSSLHLQSLVRWQTRHGHGHCRHAHVPANERTGRD